jgi:hypothetical protein
MTAATIDFDSYYSIPNWAEPTAAEAAYFNASIPTNTTIGIDWSLPSITTASDTNIYGSPKIGAMLSVSSPTYSFTSSPNGDNININGMMPMKPFALIGSSNDPDSKEERGYTRSITDTWSIAPRTDNYGYGGQTAKTASSAFAAAGPSTATSAPCTAPSGTVWLSVSDAMERSKAADMWECLHDEWTRVPTVWSNSETSVLSIKASSSIMSATALQTAKRNFKRVYVPGSLPSSTYTDIMAQRNNAPEVAIAGITPIRDEHVAAPKVLLAEAPKKSGRGGGRKRCVLFPREMKRSTDIAVTTTPTGRVRKTAASSSVKEKKSKEKAIKASTRKNTRRMRTRVNEVHHVAVTPLPSMAAAPVVTTHAATEVALPTSTILTSIPEVTPFDFEEVIDTRPGRGGGAGTTIAGDAAISACEAIGAMVSNIATTKMVSKVSYETYLVDEHGNEVSLAADGTLNGQTVIVRDDYDER